MKKRARVKKQLPSSYLGRLRCTRWLPAHGEECGAHGVRLVYDSAQVLCKKCYARFVAGRETLFNPGPGTSVQERWDLQQLLSAWADEGDRNV